MVFVNYFDNWTDSIKIDLGITKDEQTLPLALQALTLNIPNLIDEPTHLRDFITQF